MDYTKLNKVYEDYTAAVREAVRKAKTNGDWSKSRLAYEEGRVFGLGTELDSIKYEIEEELYIPQCIRKCYNEGHHLKDDEMLKLYITDLIEFCERLVQRQKNNIDTNENTSYNELELLYDEGTLQGLKDILDLLNN